MGLYYVRGRRMLDATCEHYPSDQLQKRCAFSMPFDSSRNCIRMNNSFKVIQILIFLVARAGVGGAAADGTWVTDEAGAGAGR